MLQEIISELIGEALFKPIVKGLGTLLFETGYLICGIFGVSWDKQKLSGFRKTVVYLTGLAIAALLIFLLVRLFSA